MNSCLLPIYAPNLSWKGEIDTKIIGGKGASLVKLARAGVRIPYTWVVPVEVMHIVCGKAKSIDSSMLSLLPQVLLDELRTLKDKYDGTWVVRSSAVDEDGKENKVNIDTSTLSSGTTSATTSAHSSPTKVMPLTSTIGQVVNLIT